MNISLFHLILTAALGGRQIGILVPGSRGWKSHNWWSWEPNPCCLIPGPGLLLLYKMNWGLLVEQAAFLLRIDEMCFGLANKGDLKCRPHQRARELTCLRSIRHQHHRDEKDRTCVFLTRVSSRFLDFHPDHIQCCNMNAAKPRRTEDIRRTFSSSSLWIPSQVFLRLGLTVSTQTTYKG